MRKLRFCNPSKGSTFSLIGISRLPPATSSATVSGGTIHPQDTVSLSIVRSPPVLLFIIKVNIADLPGKKPPNVTGTTLPTFTKERSTSAFGPTFSFENTVLHGSERYTKARKPGRGISTQGLLFDFVAIDLKLANRPLDSGDHDDTDV